MKEKKELRHRTHKVTLTNKNIVELAYIVKDINEHLKKLLPFADITCVAGCYELCKKLLVKVDKKYLDEPHTIAKYFGVDKAQKKLDR